MKTSVQTIITCIIKRTNVLMPRWWGLSACRMHHHMYITAGSYSHVAKRYRFVYSSRTEGVGYMYVHRLSNTMQHVLAKGAMLWHACSWDFTRLAVYLVVQMNLSKWKVVCCGKLTLHWTLNCRQQPSRRANHTITRQQRIDSKIYRIEIEDIVMLELHVCWNF